MTDDDVAQMGHSVRREESGGMVLVVICLVAIFSTVIGCTVTWAVMKAFGW